MAESAPYVMWINLAIFNLAIIFLLRFSLQNIDIKEVLREKAPAAQPPSGAAGASGPSGATAQTPDNTSYSRVAGLLGAIVLAAFFWAIGNIILYKEFACTDTKCVADIKDLISGVSTYILTGAALFAPYAVNQLTNIFKS